MSITSEVAAGATATTFVGDDHHHPGTRVLDVKLTQAAGRLENRNGKTISRLPAVSGVPFRVWVDWRNDHWIVVDWKRVVHR